MAENEQKVVIDGTEYALSSLSQEAKAQITNLRVVENEIAQLKARLAIATTAKIAYQHALKNALPVDTH
ncbi:DUF6447 family protein [Nitrosomonas sp.]|uniref:DUF6447 family protein n=1 Tax=Nitrosomonas sp. TaxID=42353 RepID=UPI001D99A742|nr:DUF6447 family protein [Nitrosomonas sp.]MCB1949927.1 hypothetical protein [Nitrosomonas sp.]MCP5243564.1 hypothetical protein [Burkholderiales bacterium]MDR4515359.1 DUF6447 family protein [Nitrosomonas sp.]